MVAVPMRIISNFECSFDVKKTYDEHICANPVSAIKVCPEDSGSPLVYIDDNRKPILIGVYSYGSSECVWSKPAVFMRVTKFVDWINGMIKHSA